MSEHDELEAIARAEHRAVLRRWGVIALALLALTAMASGVRAQLAEMLLGIGPIGTLDTVPRHLRYSGYLELQGQPVNTDGGTQIVARLYSVPDGGSSLWSQTYRPPITNGRFTLELGDEADGGVRALPYQSLATNRLFIELTVGSPAVALPRQQLLTVPYALRTGDVIVDDRTITVGATGADFTSIFSALAWLSTKVVRGSVTVQVLNGSYTMVGGLVVDHPDGARIRIIGNLNDPTQVVLNFSSGGFSILGPLGQLAGFRIVGAGVAGSTGIYVSSPAAQVGPAVRVQAYDNAVSVQYGQLTANDVQTAGLGSATGTGLLSCAGGRLRATGVTVTNANSGIYVCEGGSAALNGLSVSDVASGVFALAQSEIELSGAIQITNASTGLISSLGSVLRGSPTMTFTNVTTPRSPPLNTVGNANAFITE